MSSPSPAVAAPNLGLLVPCRDEGGVIDRRLANLLAQDWPAGARVHRVVVVDDGCHDDTGARARAWTQRFRERGVELEVIANRGRAGKCGAIRSAIAQLGEDVDLLVLSDADVVAAPDALAQLAQAFARDPRLGMACGSQHFVAALGEQGELAADAARTAGLYDRVTAWVRRLESRAGRLFSVHGQLLAWRAELGLSPTPGFAADDLDLMLQVRLLDRCVRLVDAARFFELKTPPGPVREAQALRRARAYLQFLEHPRMGELAAHGGALERAQVALYRRAPVWAPWFTPLVMALAAIGTLGLMALGQTALSFLYLAVIVLLLQSPPGQRLFRLLDTIRRARREQAVADLSDRWETPRA